MKNLRWALLGLMVGTVLHGADEKSRPGETVRTQRVEFPPGGTLRLKNAIGVLTVEAWDRPEVEITTIVSSKNDKPAQDAAKVRVTAERQGNELVVTTEFPRFRPVPLPSRNAGLRLEYRIKAPASTSVIDEHHDVGEVNIDGLTANIDVNLLQGEIMLHLPEEARYSIRAKSDFGSVNSDFSEPEKSSRWLVGHRSTKDESAAPHRLNLKVGFGDIILLKIRVPKAPEALVPAPQGETL
jgi:hypothetical protein